jgi:hypothetical protein
MESDPAPARPTPALDPEDSPFEAPPVEGIPYPKGGDEEQAIKRVIREADDERRRRERSAG